ncbi:hypothetical protein [Novosphingobium sp. LASN5T]|uniref:hypothetical protein n=1 Tax=Novosphingobium sp. LASN5T TaxID=2491021 RepID=UPI000F5F57B2|nr:hypothetical protein [Novosphingobium sp. LASN5T]RQW46094.1 hypothetical protein EH199_01680 [Novosphingobium sp. LASN5T]
MSVHALLNEADLPRPCPFAGRRTEESLHDFLLRRHGEIEGELALLREQSSLQEHALHAANVCAHRRAQWLIAAAALDACLCLAIFLGFALGALPSWLALLAVAGLGAGNLLGLAMPAAERVLAVSLRRPQP